MKKIIIKGNKLFLEDGTLIYLTQEMISRFDLKDKKIIEDNLLEEILYFRIKLSAYNLLIKREYFTKELRDKLIEKIGFPNIVDNVIDELSKKDYLDDYEKAKSYAEQHPNYGAKKLSYIFYQMGIDRDIISEILEEEKDEEIERIKALWLKLGEREERKKIESLLRKGFLYKDIKEAISLLEEEEE